MLSWEEMAKTMERLFIGIAGGSGSGKTTIVNKLKEHFGDDVCVVCHDWYYREQIGMSYEKRAQTNYDCPDAFETERLVSDLIKLRKGEIVECPQYDYTIHNRSGETLTVEPKRVIIIEGILIFNSMELVNMCDIKIYVDTDADLRILRRVLRDVNKRGRNLDSVIAQYITTVKPMHEKYVEPSKRRADIIVPEGGKNVVALDMIIERIARHLSRE